MKRHFNSILSVLLLVALVFSVTACGNGSKTSADKVVNKPSSVGNESSAQPTTSTPDASETPTPDVSITTHEHTFDDKWSVDSEFHWHAATCTEGEDCKTAVVSKVAHSDTDNNKICDVCGYDYGHTHTYDTEYTCDETGHKHVATCGCTIPAKDEGAHVDANNDGVCDICEYDGGHEHTFDNDTWTVDKDNHWHAASCGHSVVEDVEKHDFNDVGICEVCGYNKNEMTVKNAVAIGEYYEYLVNGGTIYFADDSYRAHETYIDFKFGPGMAEYHTERVADLIKQNEYYLLTEGGLFAVQEEISGEEVTISKPYNPASDILTGYGFSRVFDYDAEATYYGTTALVTGLYELGSKSAGFEEHIVIVDGVTWYSFSFAPADVYGWDTLYCYEVSVMFTLAEGGNYANVSVVSERFACEADETSEETEKVTYHKINLYPIALFEYGIEQTVGARDLTAKYDPNKVLTKDFKLTYADGTEVTKSTIKVDAGSYVQLYLVPTTQGANVALDDITVNSDNLLVNIWDATGSIGFYVGAAGKYTFTVQTAASKVKTFTVEVAAPAVTDLRPGIVDTGVFIEQSNTNLTADADLIASVIVTAQANAYADASHTASLTAGDMTAATLVKNSDGTYTLNTTAAGIWTITFTSKVNEKVTATMTVTVKAPVSEEDSKLAGHTYVYTDFGASTYFTFNTDGTLVVEDEYFWGAISGTYTYVQTANSIEIYNADGSVANFIIASATGGSGYTFLCEEQQGPGALPLLLELVESKETESVAGHKYYFTDFGATTSFEFGTDGTLVVKDDYFWDALTGTYTYVETADGIEIYHADGSAANFTIALTEDGYTFSCPEQQGPGADPILLTMEESNSVAGNKYYFTGFGATTSFEFGTDGTLVVKDDYFWDALTGVYTYVETADGIEIYNADGSAANFTIALTEDGYTFSCPEQQGPGAEPISLLLEGAGGDDDVAAIIQDNIYANETYGELNFAYNYYYDAVGGTYPDFSWDVEGTTITITWVKEPTHSLAGATFEYDTAAGEIVATLADGTTVAFTLA